MCSLGQRIVGAVCLAVGTLATGAAAGLDPYPLELGPQAQADLGSCFSQLEPGEKEVDGVLFDLAGTRLRVPPGEKRRIEVTPTACADVHFLHFTEHSGDRIGAYVLVFEDKERVEIPLRGGINIQDWWIPGPLAFASLAHSDVLLHGQNRQPVGFWRFSVQNPRPDAALVAVEIENTQDPAVINLIAITLSSACGERIGDVPVWVPGTGEEQVLTATLCQEGTAAGKEQVCEQLRRSGSVSSVPALAACLGDPRLSHAARLALEGMPFPEAGAALREALGKASGPAKVGIVESLGTRRDVAAAALLAPLLHDDAPDLAPAAALALGKIGGPLAIDALNGVLADGAQGPLERAALDGLLGCAETLRSEDEKAAHALYADILHRGARDHIRTAAYRGMIRTAAAGAQGLVRAALLSDDATLWAAALPAVRDIEGTGATPAFADLVDRVPRAVLPGLLEALAQRGDRAAAPALAPLVDDTDPEVRARAIAALSLIGDGSAVPALAKAAAHGAETDAAAAKRALARLGAPDAPAAMLSLVEEADAAETAVVAEALGKRRDSAALPALRRLARHQSGDVRTAAALALGEMGTDRDAPLLCQFAEQAEDAPARSAAERALVRLGNRLGTPERFVEAILSHVRKDNPGLCCAMLRVCGELRHPLLLQALGEAAGDGVPEVQDAVVRALAGSQDPGALAYLVPLAETTEDLTHRVLTLRGIARLASDADGMDVAMREDALTRALAAAGRADEKMLLLGALAGCHTAGALQCVQGYLGEDEVVAEAAMAWAQIAKALLASNAEEVHAAAQGVLDRAREAGVPQDVEQAVIEVVRAAAATPVPGDRVTFQRVVIDEQFRSEGVAVADVDRDGHNDILAGDVWYAAPDWQVGEVRTPQSYDPDEGYSQCFANFAADVDEDGWVDSIVIGFPGAPALWYRNPGEAPGHWEARPLAASACGETPIFGDLLGDGRPVPVFAMNSRFTWFRPHDDRTVEWQAFPVTQELPEFSTFGHGLGMGDVNGDGRIDLLGTEGWWEAPEDRARSDWAFHKAPLGPACANMVVYDVDGDGDSDVLTSSAHEYGIWWFEQHGNGAPSFEQHEIQRGISQTHALILADINNDGLKDLVTGKRYHAHNGHDPGSDEPAVLCWIELQRPEPGACRFTQHEIDNDSGVGTQFEVCDLDGDGLLDVVTSNNKGVHAFLQRRSN